MEASPPLAHLIAVNAEFAVLYRSPRCAHAQTIKGIAKRLRKLHHKELIIRKQTQKFGEELTLQGVRFLRETTQTSFQWTVKPGHRC